jgi:RHS repeat-associated protein
VGVARLGRLRYHSAAAMPNRNPRPFDVWGSQRGDTVKPATPPDHAYCGNLGHTQDDELGGLIYMRARYYEPWTGRFISEDPSYQGLNWFVYAADRPTVAADPSGKWGLLDWEKLLARILNVLTCGFSGEVAAAIAYASFAQVVARAENSLDVEQAWGQFMDTFNMWSTPDEWTVVASLGAIVATAVLLDDPVGAAVMYGMTYMFAAFTLGYLIAGYGLRVQWYIDAIDEG